MRFPEAMRVLMIMAVAAGVWVVAVKVHAAEPPKGAAGIVGTWELTIETDDGQTLHPLVEIEWDGAAFKGDYTSPEDFTPLRDVVVSGDELRFAVDTTYDLAPLEVSFKGKAANDALAGQLEYEVEGQSGALPFSAARTEKPGWAEPLEKERAVGLWKIVLSMPDGQTQEPELAVRMVEGELVGAYDTKGEHGVFKTDRVVMDGRRMIAELSGRVNETDFKATYIGVIEGDGYAGEATAVFNGQPLAFAFKATRAALPAEAAADAVVKEEATEVKAEVVEEKAAVVEEKESAVGAAEVTGVWDIRLKLPDGQVVEPTLTIGEEDGKLTGFYQQAGGPFGDLRADQVSLEDGKLFVNLSGDTGEVIFFIEYAGDVSGGEYKGDVTWEFGEMEGGATFTGKKRGGSTAEAPADAVEAEVEGAVEAGVETEVETEVAAEAVVTEEPIVEPAIEKVDLSGEWELRVYDDNGNEEWRTIAVSEDSKDIAYKSPLGDRTATAVVQEGAALSFTVEGELNGMAVISRYSGKLENGKLVGSVSYEYGEQKGEVEFEGTRD